MLYIDRNFAVSIGIICLTTVVCNLSRRVLNSLKISEFHRQLGLETIATFELCANCFEFGIVIEHHGFLPYSFLMLFLFNYWGSTWKASASVCGELLSVFENKKQLSSALLAILFQALGACLVYQMYTKPIWSFGIHDRHLDRLVQTDCYTHLQVSPMNGVLVEAAATFTFLTALNIFGGTKHGFITLPVIMLSIIYTAMNYTGGYFNPILASTVQYGCKGVTGLEHFIVYWVGPAIGVVLHKIAFNYSSKSFHSTKKIN